MVWCVAAAVMQSLSVQRSAMTAVATPLFCMLVQLIIMAAARASGEAPGHTPVSATAAGAAPTVTAATAAATSRRAVEGSMEFDQRCSNSMSAEEAHERR